MVIYIQYLYCFLNCIFLIASCACIRLCIRMYIYINATVWGTQECSQNVSNLVTICNHALSHTLSMTDTPLRNRWLSIPNKTWVEDPYKSIQRHAPSTFQGEYITRHLLYMADLSWARNKSTSDFTLGVVMWVGCQAFFWGNSTKWNQNVICYPVVPYTHSWGLCQQPIREEMYHFQPKLRESHVMSLKSHPSAEHIEMKTAIHQRVRDGTFPYTSHSRLLALDITNPWVLSPLPFKDRGLAM